jgi:uncharacterized protein
MKFLFAAIVTALMFLGAAHAADYQKGLAAAKSGDYATALHEWTLLAEQGNARAQFNLGIMYDKGQGVTQDDAKAMTWFRKAAEQGLAEAQYNLGVMYDEGQGVTKDYAEAVKWWRKASEQGLAEAQGNLGAFYALGRSVLQDNVTAHMWINISSANGKKDSAEVRDLLAKEMTPADISEAQRRARVCMKSNYWNCD